MRRGCRSIAIALLHAYLNPIHEQQLAQLAAELGFSQVSTSHEVSGLAKLVGRGDTTVVDAYLSPILRRYVDQVAGALNIGGNCKALMFMQSNGGLTDAQKFQGKDAILSGPAGGIVGMVQTGQQAGFDQLIGFDMGGTSTDVSHFAGKFERSFETEVAGVRMRAPMMDIHTVAAGGGSICSYRDGRFQVGPESAGADPGPASYRRGGPLTVTDCNVILGALSADYFPAVFGVSGTLPWMRRRLSQGSKPWRHSMVWRGRQKIWRRAFWILPCRIWPMRSRKLASSAAMTSRPIRFRALVGREGSMPVWWPKPWACRG